MSRIIIADDDPAIVIQGDATPVTYHWLTKGVPVYAIKSGDTGLRWDVVSWKDNP